VRRGAAWLAERPSSYPARQQAVSRRQLAPPPSRHGRQAPQAPSTGTPLAGPARGCWAWWPRRCGRRPCLRQRVHILGQRPVAGVLCPVRTSNLHACLSTRPVSRVRCGRLNLRVSGVRCGCPVSVCSRVRCVRPGEVVEGGGGQAAAWLGWRGRRARPLCPRPVRRNRGSRLRRPRWARGRRLGLGRRCGRWWGGG
jgi:hypothetical protein